MKNINAIKNGNVVNISIDGKLQKKNCGSPKEADELYRIVLKAKADPNDANLKAIRCYLNEKLRIALVAGLETDVENNEVYLAGFNTPLPMTLVDVIKEYHENGYPMDAIINFWKLLMINPDVRVRKSLFDFITTHDFVLTDKGYMVVYKAVYRKDESKEKKTNRLSEFITNQWLHVKKDWKCAPNKYVVFQYLNEIDKYGITKTETANSWNEVEKNVSILGKLGDMYDNILTDEVEAADDVPVYTDMHTRKMSIVLGKPVVMERKECDSDPAVDCSYGLHCGATAYVERFGNNGRSIILACLVNPANVVAVPNYDHSKMRVSEYFPFAYATYENDKIDIIEQKYFESDYCTHEAEELEKMVANVRADEKPIQTAINAEEEVRPMSELVKILETRLFDIS
ncbi:MAG: hypothetical protein JXB49_14285 [Bacteroidales bacterium]|nr:hypothetical protein [Bacteroidales bacterium]